jgi:F-type H+-transporting ATPase subunit epsilon
MRFRLLTLTGSKYADDIAEVIVPTESGEIGILPNHEDITSIVVPGAVTVRKITGQTDTFVTFGGLVQVEGDVCKLLSDQAEHSDELIESEIEVALAQAQALQSAAKDKHELAQAQSLIDRHTVRLDVARIKRRKHRS